MSSDEPLPGRCAAQTRDGGYCENYPKGDNARCRMHGADSPGGDGAAPKGNGNAETHGLTAERDKWFNRHREDAAELVRALVASYVDDAPFGWEQTAKVDKLTEVAIDQARLRQSNEYLDEFLTEQVVDVTETGREITKLEENPAHMPRDRIKRTNLRILRDLGILDDPDSQQASATKSLADILSDD